jgi:hypothetical protein
MKRHFFPIFVGLLSIAAAFALVESRAVTVNAASSTAVFDSRRWVFVGAPLTSNGRNNGKAGFPEYHHVYVEEKNLDAYLKTGSFPEEPSSSRNLHVFLIPRFLTGHGRNLPGGGISTASSTVST